MNLCPRLDKFFFLSNRDSISEAKEGGACSRRRISNFVNRASMLAKMECFVSTKFLARTKFYSSFVPLFLFKF